MRRQTLSILTAVSFFGLTAVTTQLLVQRVHSHKSEQVNGSTYERLRMGLMRLQTSHRINGLTDQ